MRYYLNVGSNLGERRDNLMRAVAALAALSSTGACELSTIIESAPWGYASAHAFLNIGVTIDSDITPAAMLARLQALERLLGSAPHRTPQGTYADRLLDIDIVAIDDMVINTPILQVPHPQLQHRDFFLIPLVQTAPHWVHPTLHVTAARLLERLGDEPPRRQC